MYISVPKNYGGSAFSRQSDEPARDENPTNGFSHRALPLPNFAEQPQAADIRPSACDGECLRGEKECDNDVQEHEQAEVKECSCGEDCPREKKNPLTCLFEALRGRKKAGFDADDFLLVGLIALLIGREGNEDIVLILALLLLV